MSRDAVIIGAGADELVAARLLAKGGWRVVVLEERVPKGLETGWTPPAVLQAVGLNPRQGKSGTWAAVQLPDGEWLELSTDMARSIDAIRRVSPRDAQKWPSFCARMRRLGALLEELYVQPPRTPLDVGFALKVRRLGREGMEDLMRLLPMPVAELLDEWFENDALKGLLASAALRHLQHGPRSAGTAFAFLHHHAGAAQGVFRQPVNRLRETLRQAGGLEVRSARASGIEVRDGEVSGVRIEDGEVLPASLVVSGAHPRRTLLELVDAAWIDPDLGRAVSHVRARGVAMRVSLRRGSPDGRVIAPSLDALERAYDATKYRRASETLWAEARSDGERTEVHVQCVPYGAVAPASVEPALSALGLAAAGATVEAPTDLEQTEGWPEGQPFHAELALDQALWMRPVPALARYRTPVAGLWLCGPASHPGAGILGASGYNCAREIARQR